MSIATVTTGRVFGISSSFADHFHLVRDGNILYAAGNNILLYDIDQKSQKFIPVADTGETITAIAVSPDRHVFAVAYKSSSDPSVCIYDSQKFRKKRKLSIPKGILEFSALSFSGDGKFLLLQSSRPTWSLYYYPWERGKSAGSIVVSELPVTHISFNPFNSTEFSAFGESYLSIFKHKDGEIIASNINMPHYNYRCHSWISNDRMLVGAKEGKLVLLESGIVVNTFEFNGGTEAVNCITPSKHGVAIAGESGTLCLYSFAAEIPEVILSISLPEQNMAITGISTIQSESLLLVKSSSHQIFKLSLAYLEENDTAKKDKAKFEIVVEASHSGAVNCLDLCIRKPLLVTCSADRSIRVWNYLSAACELTKYFGDEPLSVALHPSGLYILAGFSDKLRLFNILMNDLRLVKEFSIRACKRCCFSNGGHLIAAANGNAIQIFSAWTFDIIENLKGHNGKVRSLYFPPDDMSLVTAGSDGSVYTWDMSTMRRENEHSQKSCSYFDAVCSPNSKTMFAVGTDRQIKEITDSNVTKHFEGSQAMTQIILSNSGSMLIAGMHSGAIRALRFPLGDRYEFQEYQAHNGPVTKLKISFDDQYLFTAGEDGCVFMFQLTDNLGISKPRQEYAASFADEILFTKSDLEENAEVLIDIQRQLDELKLDHEYQLRLRDMNFNDKLKSVTENYSKEIEGLKTSTSLLRTEKEKEDVKHQEQIQNLKAKNMAELHEIDVKNNASLMAEYEKLNVQQGKTSALQTKWQKMTTESQESSHKTLAQAQANAEAKLRTKTLNVQKLTSELREKEAEYQEMKKQNQEDVDAEIEIISARFDKKLKEERDEGARLKGENGIMNKKFISLNKDIEENKGEAQKMRESMKKHDGVVAALEKEIAILRKEMSDRDEYIQDKERKVYDLKKRNQELEKFKFVLDYKIKELKEQVEPREKHFSEIAEKIQNINQKLEALSKQKVDFERQIGYDTEKLAQAKAQAVKEHRKAQKLDRHISLFKNELQELMFYFQDHHVLKRLATNFCKKYCKNEEKAQADEQDLNLEKELARQHQALQEKVKSLRAAAEKRLITFRNNTARAIGENQELIRQVYELRGNSFIM